MENWIPALTGFIGVVIGATIPAIVSYFQTKELTKAERLKIATQLAVEDSKLQLEASNGSGKTRTLYPLAIFFKYHWDIINLKNLDTKNLEEVTTANRELMKKLKELDKDFRAETKKEE